MGHGVFAEPSPGVFAMNEAAEELKQPFLDLGGIGGRMAHAWGTLETFVRTGRPGYAERFGRPWWDDLAAHPELGAEFDELMGYAGHGAPDVDFPIDWDGIETVVDVGGGTGALLTELLRRRPALRATLVDLPGHGRSARRATSRRSASPSSTRSPTPTSTSSRASSTTGRTRRRTRSWPTSRGRGPRAVVIGGVAPDDAPRRLDIEMVLLGGRTDTLSEFRERAARAGLRGCRDARPSGGVAPWPMTSSSPSACARSSTSARGVVEKKMFGGLGFMIDGHWAVGVMRSDQMVVRVEPEEIDEAIRRACTCRTSAARARSR